MKLNDEHSFFARRVSSIDSRLSQAKRVLDPLIEERISKFKEYGKDGYPDMPVRGSKILSAVILMFTLG